MSTSFNLEEYINHHIHDSRQWQLPFLPTIQLPPFLSLHGVMLLIGTIILLVIFCVFYDKKQRVPHGFTNLLEFFVVFIRDEIAIKNLGEEEGRRMTPFLCNIFFFILILNLMGLIPLFTAATANPNVTFALAFFTLCFMIVGTISKNGFKGFLKALIPSGVPWPILIILLPMEFLGIFTKAFALMIRLFANMLAGHIMIFCLLGMVILMGAIVFPALAGLFVGSINSSVIIKSVGGVIGLSALMGLILFVAMFEVFVAFLQAYIFAMLSAVFIGRMYDPDH